MFILHDYFSILDVITMFIAYEFGSGFYQGLKKAWKKRKHHKWSCDLCKKEGRGFYVSTNDANVQIAAIYRHNLTYHTPNPVHGEEQA